MYIVTGDAFKVFNEYDAFCIPTNGYLKDNGHNVMGAGIAKIANEKWSLASKLGYYLKLTDADIPYVLDRIDNTYILNFPVKPVYRQATEDNIVGHMKGKFKLGDYVPGWACKAEIQIIKRSIYCLQQMVDFYGWNKILLPKPGCGNGGLKWDEVKLAIQSILDNRFFIIDKGTNS